MEIPVKEKTKLNSFDLISAICLFACIILLAVNLFLPLILQKFGLPNVIGPLNVILFCIHALILIFAAITLLAKPMEKLFSLSAFLLGAMHICYCVMSVISIAMQIIAINQMGVHRPATYFSVDFAGAVAVLLLAAALIVLGVTSIMSQRKPINKFLCFVPAITAVISAFLSGLTVLAQIINTVTCFTEHYPRLQIIVTIHSLAVRGISFGEILLYTVAIALIGMSMAKKKSA